MYKKISYIQDREEYAVLVVIHNQKTERICDSEEQWSWPEHNENGKTEIGDMYYCSIDSENINMKDLDIGTNPLPFDLNGGMYENKKMEVLKTKKFNNP